MTTKIDKFGRILLPKALRDSLRLREGDTLRIEASEDGVQLRPVVSEGALVREGKLLVWYGEGADKVDLVEFINQERDRRIQDVIRHSMGEKE